MHVGLLGLFWFFTRLGQLTRRGWPSWSVCESVLVGRKDEADWFCAARRTRAGCECGRFGEAGRGGV